MQPPSPPPRRIPARARSANSPLIVPRGMSVSSSVAASENRSGRRRPGGGGAISGAQSRRAARRGGDAFRVPDPFRARVWQRCRRAACAVELHRSTPIRAARPHPAAWHRATPRNLSLSRHAAPPPPRGRPASAASRAPRPGRRKSRARGAPIHFARSPLDRAPHPGRPSSVIRGGLPKGRSGAVRRLCRVPCD